MRSKLSTIFIVLFLLATIFVIDNRIASACSLGKGDFTLDFHEKYRLVNFDDRNYGSYKSDIQKKYPKTGLYDIATDKLLWETNQETFRFPRDSKVYITEDGVYMVKVDLQFLPSGLAFYKNGVLTEHYYLGFFDAIPTEGGGDCLRRWIASERFVEAEGKYYLRTLGDKEYVFSIFTGNHLKTMDYTAPTKKQDELADFLSSPVVVISSVLFLIFVLYVIDILHFLRAWFSRFKKP
jgi:hypothetical protein